jgi:2-polyprenyl-3-methyl-5-hydroxy-6-metoxy-1,4-benzoquinol methylase
MNRSDRCPLCRRTGDPVLALEFAPKPPLSNSISFRWCCKCDYIFAANLNAEGYRTFYRTALHDTAHISDVITPDNLYVLQSRLLADYLGREFSGNCLDFGAGEGQLLGALAKSLPRAKLYGSDLRNSLRPGTPASFLEALDAATVKFDLIILSHVAEHLVDLSDVATVLKHLAPNGLLYLEVPDPIGYPCCARREYMYYFDRLHVNHFSQAALGSWLARYSLGITKRGTHRFAYRDGQYPAQYVFASPTSPVTSDLRSHTTLRQALTVYQSQEAKRAAAVRDGIIKAGRDHGLIVYGRGDNYYRARSQGGPLNGVSIDAILDRNAETLARDGDIPVLNPSRGLTEYPEAVILMTVSASAEQIVAEIQARAPGRIVMML